MKSVRVVGLTLTAVASSFLSPISAYAAVLDCKTISSAPAFGRGFAEAKAVIPPADVKLGFRVTGGGCLLKPAAGGEHYGYLEESVPDTANNAYTCSVRGVGDTDGVRVTAYVVACKIP